MRLLLALAVTLPLFSAQDPRIKIQNEYVKVLDVIDPPHSKTGKHQHTVNRVMIYLDEGTQRITFDPNDIQNHRWKRNEVFWSPAGGMHISENVGESPIRIIEIELTKPTGGLRLSELDPMRVDASHYRVLLENPHVRVFHVQLPPGYQAPVHEHLGPRVTVFLTDTKVNLTMPDGTARLIEDKRGDMLWGTAAKHAEKNVGSEPVEMVVVEPK